MELLPNFHWIKISYVNAYLCVDGSELTLIDTGMPKNAGKILSYIESIGYAPSALKQILLTHGDIDHVGSLAELMQITNAKAYAGVETAKLLNAGKFPKHLPRIAQFIADHLYKLQPVPNVTPFHDEEILPFFGGLQVVASPGHTQDHHSLYSMATGILFAGDALSTRKDQIQLSAKRITADMRLAHHSARRLLQLNPTLFACGHGKPMQEHNSDDLMNLLQILKDSTK